MGNIIRNLRLERNLTQDQLAEHLGVSVSVIKKWESNSRIPKLISREAICDFFSIDMNYLMGLTPIKVSLSEERIIQIPLYDCSGLNESFDAGSIVDTVILPKYMLNPDRDYFAICIRDNSVVDANLKKGDIAVFEKAKFLYSEQIGLFLIGNEVCCRYYVNEKKNIRLLALNTDYGSFENTSFIILGKLALKISNEQFDFIPDPDL